MKVKAKIENMVECFTADCPICGYTCRVEFSGEGADCFEDDTCEHYVEQEFDFNDLPEKVEFEFIKKG